MTTYGIRHITVDASYVTHSDTDAVGSYEYEQIKLSIILTISLRYLLLMHIMESIKEVQLHTERKRKSGNTMKIRDTGTFHGSLGLCWFVLACIGYDTGEGLFLGNRGMFRYLLLKINSLKDRQGNIPLLYYNLVLSIRISSKKTKKYLFIDNLRVYRVFIVNKCMRM